MLLVGAGCLMLLTPASGREQTVYLYLDDDDNADSVYAKLDTAAATGSLPGFRLLDACLGYSQRIRPGRYAVTPDMSTLRLFRNLRNGSQAPVKLTIPVVRTPERLAAELARHLQPDSATLARCFADEAFCRRYGCDTATLLCLFLPNTYDVWWNTTPDALMRRMQRESRAFWTDERREQARAAGLTPNEVITLASIVEQETADNSEKPRVAGMYLNRLHRGMKLQADPTVKYALGDFSLRRILHKHLAADSPYNTYRYAGLPPGPICIPSLASIEAVLRYERHNYIFMCAKEDFSGSHNFAATGGSRTITVNSSGEWRIGTRTYDWGHLTVNGNTLTVMVDENTNTTQRTDYFTVKSGDMERRINITQQGKTAVLQPSRTATIKSVTVNNDADVDGKKGLSVKVSFNIKGMKGHDAKMSCYFHDSAGNALIDTNGAYCTSGKTPKVAVSREFKPLYENTVFTNLEVKIPYDELHLQGLYPRTLKVDVIIWDYTTSSPTEMARKYNTTFTCTPFPLVPYLKVDGMATDRTIKFEASGGRKRYSVSTDARTYETWGVPAWCSIVDKTASGFTLACNRNYSSLPRNDYMLVKASGKEVRINIKQDAKSGPTVAINKIWVDHNVFNGAVKGMNVHVKMDVSGMKGQTIKYYVRFYQENNLTQLIDGNGNPIYAYQTSVVKYENSTYNDWSIFIPNSNIFSAVNSNGRFSLDVEIRDNNGKLLAKKENYQFHTI